MTWTKALWESMTWRDFDILTQRRSSRPLESLMPHVIRNENSACYDLESTLVMDSKGLLAALDNDLSQDDRKSSLEVPISEVFMRRAVSTSMKSTQSKRSLRDDEVQGSTFGTVVHAAAHWDVHVEKVKRTSWPSTIRAVTQRTYPRETCCIRGTVPLGHDDERQAQVHEGICHNFRILCTPHELKRKSISRAQDWYVARFQGSSTRQITLAERNKEKLYILPRQVFA